MAPAKKNTKSKAKKSASGVIEIDLNKVEVREVYDGDDPRPGFYTFECVNVRTHTSQGGNEGFAWLFSLRDDPTYEGWTRTVYSNLDKDSTKWKTEEIMLALAGGKAVQGTKAAQVSLDVTDEESVKRFLKKAKLVRGRVQRDRDSDDDDPSFSIGKIIALDEAKMAARKAALSAVDDDEDEDGFEDADEFEDADDADEDEEDDEEDEEDEDEDDEDSDDDEDDDEDEDLDDEDEDDEEEEPEPPKKSKKATPAKTASKPVKKAASKVTNISDAKSKKTKRK
jgi:hypothetical protein